MLEHSKTLSWEMAGGGIGGAGELGAKALREVQQAEKESPMCPPSRAIGPKAARWPWANP